MMNQLNFRLCQININNQKNLIITYEQLLNNRFDLICAQEPYSFKNIFSSKSIVIKNHSKFRCANFYVNQNLKIFANYENTDEYFSIATIEFNQNKFYLINCYFPPKGKENIQVCTNIQNKLQRLLINYANKPTLFLGDFTAKSKAWSPENSDHNDARGLWLFDLLVEHDYLVLNDYEQGPTYDARSGTSYIDVAFGSLSFCQTCDCVWNIAKFINSTSDHNPIEIEITSRRQAQYHQNVIENDSETPTKIKKFVHLKTL